MSINASTSQNQILNQLITEAKQAATKERRSEERIPYFHAVSIAVNGRCYTAFSREISSSAIGLLHNMELPLGEAKVSISTRSGIQANLLIRMRWCESCGEGWYISGGEFVGIGGDRV